MAKRVTDLMAFGILGVSIYTLIDSLEKSGFIMVLGVVSSIVLGISQIYYLLNYFKVKK